MHSNQKFLFVGYLVQEPYLSDARFPGMRLATIDREICPEFDFIRYEKLNGVPNVTKFLTFLPDMSKYPSWMLNGYAIDSNKVTPELGIDGTTVFPSKYKYAEFFERPKDNMRIIGYDVVDEITHPFSVLHYEQYSMREIEDNGGKLNSWGLFDSVGDATRFCDYVLEVNQRDGTIWEVWG